MLITPAYAQGAGAAGGPDLLMSILPFVLIFVIMYFLIIRPQRQRMKQHQEMVNNLRRGDTVVTGGGLIGKISKVVDDGEVQVELADGLKVRVVRSMITEVRSKTEPVKENG
ncbi:preprotein translocase subunit YajC [Stappia sp.]|uniref:preprotein translocase subunit YajC n=1 Tax=Stappia sp. TaxID=1870903 RepID=UPI0032D8FA8E